MCVCVCVRERERERESVCVCVREKKRGGGGGGGGETHHKYFHSVANICFVFFLSLLFILSSVVSAVEQAISDINQCVSTESDDPEATLAALSNQFAQLNGIDETCGTRYHVALRQTKEDKGEDLTQTEIGDVIERVNEEVRLERLGEGG